jgi:hypothetical protein
MKKWAISLHVLPVPVSTGARRVVVAGSALAAVLIGAAAIVGAAAIASPAALPGKLLATDTREGGKLDLRSARGPVASRVCAVTISTWKPWSLKILNGSNYAPGKNRLAVVYDLNGDGKPDVTGYVISENGGRYVYLFIRTSTDSLPPRVVGRPNASSVFVPICAFVYDIDPPYPKTIRVAFVSVNGSHWDRMPARGWIRFHDPLLG